MLVFLCGMYVRTLVTFSYRVVVFLFRSLHAGDVAFIGSYCSNEVVSIDLSDLVRGNLSLIETKSDPAYENMVSYHDPTTIGYVACGQIK